MLGRILVFQYHWKVQVEVEIGLAVVILSLYYSRHQEFLNTISFFTAIVYLTIQISTSRIYTT